VNTVILIWQRPLWEGDQEVVKRSGRDEPIWVVIHKCMEATQGISWYSYLHLKPAKTLYAFLFNKITEKRLEQVLPRDWGEGGCGDGLNNVYTCK
jgi:hypothetical protein